MKALTRKTHAFAKTATTWDALVDLHVFEQTWLHPHPALREPVVGVGRAFLAVFLRNVSKPRYPDAIPPAAWNRLTSNFLPVFL